MKRAVITILGTIGGRFDQNLRKFVFVSDTNKSKYIGGDVINLVKDMYVNTLPVLIDAYPDADIIPIYTKDAREVQERVLKELEKKGDYLYIFENGYEIKDENNFDEIFSLFEEIFKKDYDEFIIDVTHGFRHLPLLLLIELLIKNFQDNSKISKILFAKELDKPTKDNNFSGKYQFIDLKEYLDLANVAFVLETFEKNYTLPLHIQLGKEFEELTLALKKFSEDIMALNIDSLFKVAVPGLIEELEKINKPSIKNQVEGIISHLEEDFEYEGKRRWETYYNVAYELKEKGYLLNSLALLYESVRLFLKAFLEYKYPEIMKKVEEFYEGDDYKIGDFCMNKVFNVAKRSTSIDKAFDRNCKVRIRGREIEIITFDEYQKLIKAIEKEFLKEDNCLYDKKRKRADLFNCISYARNNFAHANKENDFKEVKTSIDKLFSCFKNKTEKYKSVLRGSGAR
jgi:CRISPR-associated DxTHG motif protein